MSPSQPPAPADAPVPVIRLWGNLVVALQGDVGDAQLDRLCDDVLAKLRDGSIGGLVIDASGLWLVDSHLSARLGKLAGAARLMGARCVLSGLGPDIVMTLQDMGFDLRGIRTALGLEEALELLGVRVVVAPVHDEGEP